MSAFEKELYEVNAKLCKAVGAHPVLYDRNNAHYKKKSPTDRSWEIVSEECSDSVPNCKRRWRQIREEYTRYFTDSPKRRKTTRNKPFYLQDVLKFLLPFIPNSGDSTESVEEVTMKETTTIEEQNGKDTKKGKQKEHDLLANKSDIEMITNADEFEQSLTTDQSNTVSKEEEDESLNKQVYVESQVVLNEVTGQLVAQDEPTFYIKQSSNDPCTLTISKVTDPLETSTIESIEMSVDNELNNKELQDEDDVPLAGRGRRTSKRSIDKQAAQLHGVKEIPVRRKEARVTRTRNAHKPISVATVGALVRELISPLPKMTPVPKAKQPTTPQQPRRPPSAVEPSSPQSKVVATPEQHEDVKTYAKQRTRLTTPQPSPSQKKQTGNNNNIKTSQEVAKNSEPAKAKSTERIDLTSPSVESAVPLAATIAEDVEMTSTKSTKDTTVEPQDTSMIVRVVPTREDRGVQCGPAQDEFTDDDFLNCIRPQMREMNPRQKMHFKKKVFQSIMEVFDDATDFPNAGEVQHFNINTPSGFENSTTQELRLMRELVALVTAAKRTTELQKMSASQQRLGLSSGRQSPADAAVSTTSNKNVTTTVVQQSPDELGLPRNVIQRVLKIHENAESAPDRRCIYRIVPKTGQIAKAANVNNTSPGRSTTETAGQRAGTFVIGGSGTAKVSPNANTNANSAPNANNKNFVRPNASGSGGGGILELRPNPIPTIGRPRLPETAQVGPIRTMARRYSVCGITPANGTATQVAAVAASSGNGNGDIFKVISRTSLGLMANGLPAGGNASNVANVNGRQVAVNRRSPSANKPYPLSSGRARYPAIGPKVAGGVQSTAGETAGKDKGANSEFMTPPNPRKVVNEANSAGAVTNQLRVTGELRKSTSPYKRHVQYARNIPQTSTTSNAASTASTTANNVDKSADANRSRLFNNDKQQMQVAGTIAADDFSSVRIKQEVDLLSGM